MADRTDLRRCSKCGQGRPPKDFYPNKKSNRCRECTRKRMQERYQPFRDWLDAYKLDRGCVDCGYREHPEALEFDHLPGHEKVMKVASLVARCNMALLQAEIAKCEVVCANCHRIRTSARRLTDGNTNGGWDLRKKQPRLWDEAS